MLPPQKRRRVCSKSQWITGTNRLTHTVLWNKRMINILISGLARQNIQHAITDICGIIFMYLFNMLMNYHINNVLYTNINYFNDNTIICKFYETSNVLFTPILCTCVKKITMTVIKQVFSCIDLCCFTFGIICIPQYQLNVWNKNLPKLKQDNVQLTYNLFDNWDHYRLIIWNNSTGISFISQQNNNWDRQIFQMPVSFKKSFAISFDFDRNVMGLSYNDCILGGFLPLDLLKYDYYIAIGCKFCECECNLKLYA